jgi:hypothetical protein
MIIKDKSIIYNGDKIVDEWNIELNLGYDHLLVGMSGGMDSSILLWMMAYHMDQNRLDGTIHAYSATHEERPWQAHHAKKVLKYVKESFPNVKFGKHFESTTPGCQYIENGTKLQWRSSWFLAQSGGTVATYNGVTLNPPDELGEPIWKHAWDRRSMNRNADTIDQWDIDGEMIEHNNPDFFDRMNLPFLEEMVHFGTNDEEQIQAAIDNNEYHIQHYPFCKLDKRVVLAFYKKYGQLVSLGELTNSCEGAIWKRGNPKFSKPCHWCWWCIEKEWATAAIYHYDATQAMKDWPAFR